MFSVSLVVTTKKNPIVATQKIKNLLLNYGFLRV